MEDNNYNELIGVAKFDPLEKQGIEKKVSTVKFKHEFGDDEKHTVAVIVNQYWGYIDIKIDGIPYMQKRLAYGWNLMKREWTIEFEVGDVEKHRVKVIIYRSFQFVPLVFHKCSTSVYIDGENQGVYSGKFSYKDRFFIGMNNKSIALGITWFILLIFIYIGAYTIPLKIQQPIPIKKQMSGILFREGDFESVDTKELTIILDGAYRQNILNPNCFLGKIYIKGLNPYTLERFVVERMIVFNENNLGRLTVTKVRSDSPDEYILTAYITMDKNGESIMLLLLEEDEYGEMKWNGTEGGLFYVAPCNNREEALAIANSYEKEIFGEDAISIE